MRDEGVGWVGIAEARLDQDALHTGPARAGAVEAGVAADFYHVVLHALGFCARMG
ncbi:MAG: hypothetical protein AAF565_00640 [Pseudomonadota bacterium]